MSSAVSIPVVGTSVTVGPLHVADAGSNTVTYNGQHALAGSTATIGIPEDVRVLTISQHPGQSSWTSGQIPTLNPALGVIGPQVITALEEANGAAVTITYDGTSWYASTVTPQATNTPMGATLPADNTGGDLFILTATDGTNLPGLYFWDGTQFTTTEPAAVADIDSATEVFSVPANVWIFGHGLGRPVSVRMFDGLDPTNPGSEILGSVTYIDANTARIEYLSARTGHAVAT